MGGENSGRRPNPETIARKMEGVHEPKFFMPAGGIGGVKPEALRSSPVDIINSAGRWLLPVIDGVNTTSQTATAGDVLLFQFNVTSSCSVDGIGLRHGATASGNAVVGIYGPISQTSDTCNNAPVIVQSSSTALVGTLQVVTFTETALTPGIYYAAVEYEDALHTFFRFGNTTQVGGVTQKYSRGGGYGALTDPCPAVSDTLTAFPNIKIRRSA